MSASAAGFTEAEKATFLEKAEERGRAARRLRDAAFDHLASAYSPQTGDELRDALVEFDKAWF